MKGLFAYDLIWIGKQKRLLMICLLLTVMYILMDMGLLALGLIPFLIAMLATRTLLNELESPSSKFLFALPFTRQDYVVEKYILALLLPLASILLIALGLSAAGKIALPNAVSIALGTWMSLCIAMSVFIPLVIRFKSKVSIYMMVLMFALILIGVFAEDYLPPAASWLAAADLPAWLTSQTFLLGAGAAIAVISVCLSMLCSMKLMTKEEI